MKQRTRTHHVIDAMFPIALFFLFTASLIIVLLLAARIYSHTTQASGEHYNARTAYAYVMEKFRQNDSDGDISVETIDGTPCLTLNTETEQGSIVTYVYAHNHKLMELQVRPDVDFSLSDGSEIAALESLEINESSDGLFEFTFTGSDGSVMTMTLSERSRS